MADTADIDFSESIASLSNMAEKNAEFQIAFQEASMEINADNKVSQVASNVGK